MCKSLQCIEPAAEAGRTIHIDCLHTPTHWTVAKKKGVTKPCSVLAAKKLEDPRRMLDQAVSEMKEDLIKMRQASAEVMSTQKMLESKYTQAQASAVSLLLLPMCYCNAALYCNTALYSCSSSAQSSCTDKITCIPNQAHLHDMHTCVISTDHLHCSFQMPCACQTAQRVVSCSG